MLLPRSSSSWTTSPPGVVNARDERLHDRCLMFQVHLVKVPGGELLRVPVETYMPPGASVVTISTGVSTSRFWHSSKRTKSNAALG